MREAGLFSGWIGKLVPSSQPSGGCRTPTLSQADSLRRSPKLLPNPSRYQISSAAKLSSWGQFFPRTRDGCRNRDYLPFWTNTTLDRHEKLRTLPRGTIDCCCKGYHQRTRMIPRHVRLKLLPSWLAHGVCRPFPRMDHGAAPSSPARKPAKSSLDQMWLDRLTTKRRIRRLNTPSA